MDIVGLTELMFRVQSQEWLLNLALALAKVNFWIYLSFIKLKSFMSPVAHGADAYLQFL